MQVAGIICEFNPFHKGHAYLISQAKKNGADIIVALMSGDFVQRGETAVISKYERTKQALDGGADFVFELPVRYALSSAGDFALGGILALKSLNVVTDLYFGSECGDISALKKTAAILQNEPEEFSLLLQKNLKQGLSYPAARAKALSAYTSLSSALCSEPNNILGMEYCRAIETLGAGITPHTILRQGNHYHEENLPDKEQIASGIFPSATAKRLEIYKNNEHHLRFDDCSSAIGQFLLRLQQNNTALPKDMTPFLADRMKNLANEYTNASGFIKECQTRTFTSSRIRRTLLQGVIGILPFPHTMPYLRLLGMKKNVGPFLKEIRNQRTKDNTFDVITKLSAAEDNLRPEAITFLQMDIFSSHWYRQMWQMKYGVILPNEYQRPIIIF